MRETTEQRNSRIAQDDSAAHRICNHARDFFNGLATYEIKQDGKVGYSYYQYTPSGQLSGWAKTYEDAVARIEAMKNADICCGYPREQLMGR